MTGNLGFVRCACLAAGILLFATGVGAVERAEQPLVLPFALQQTHVLLGADGVARGQGMLYVEMIAIDRLVDLSLVGEMLRQMGAAVGREADLEVLALDPADVVGREEGVDPRRVRGAELEAAIGQGLGVTSDVLRIFVTRH